MEFVLMGFGTILLTAAFGTLVKGDTEGTLHPFLFYWLSVIFLLLGTALYVMAGWIVHRKEREAKQQEIERYNLLKESRDIAKEAHNLAKLNSQGPSERLR